MSNNFDPNWPHGHITRDGRKARIICTDAANASFPIVALVEGPGTIERAFMFGVDGYSINTGYERLLNAPAPKRKVRFAGWMNVYADGTSDWWVSRGKANEYGESRIACIHIDREVEEGEGL